MKIKVTREECAAAVAKAFGPGGTSVLVVWEQNAETGELLGAELTIGPLVDGAPSSEDPCPPQEGLMIVTCKSCQRPWLKTLSGQIECPHCGSPRRRLALREWCGIALLALLLYVPVASIRYRVIHPELTETQHAAHMWSIVTWGD